MPQAGHPLLIVHGRLLNAFSCVALSDFVTAMNILYKDSINTVNSQSTSDLSNQKLDD